MPEQVVCYAEVRRFLSVPTEEVVQSLQNATPPSPKHSMDVTTLLEARERCLCPITKCTMMDPVLAEDGHVVTSESSHICISVQHDRMLHCTSFAHCASVTDHILQYEREAIMDWLSRSKTSPMTKQPMSADTLKDQYHAHHALMN